MEFIVFIYLFFIFVSLYFSFLFLVLFFSNKNLMMDDKKARKFPKLTVLIPAFNEETTIAGTINHVLAVNYPKKKMDIIVIDDGSTDNTYKIAKSFGVKVLKKKNSGKADSLNLALKKAKGELVTIVDADGYPAKDSFLKMVQKFEEKKVGAVTSAVLVRNQDKFIEKMQEVEYTIIAWARKLLEFLGCVYVTPGALSMYRKKYIKNLGGFDRNILTEDIEIAWRLLKNNYVVKMALTAKVHTIVPATIKKWWRQRVRWHIGGLQTTLKYTNLAMKKSYGMLGLFVTPFFMLSFVLSIAGFGVFSYYFSRKIISMILTTFYSTSLEVSPLQVTYLSLMPTVFTFFIIMMFVVTFIYVVCGLITMTREKMGLKRLITAEIYILFYLVCYPINLIHALWLLTINKIEW